MKKYYLIIITKCTWMNCIFVLKQKVTIVYKVNKIERLKGYLYTNIF